MQITLRINQQDHTVDVEPETPLLWVIRDAIGLTGTKYGCGISQCGACTVHIDGQPAKACDTRVSAAIGRDITTIEGLSPDGSHPAQLAWKELSVAQCGFCQSGQIMRAAALLAASPNPSDGEIDSTMSDNICRCGTYLRIRSAIHRAAEIGQSQTS